MYINVLSKDIISIRPHEYDDDDDKDDKCSDKWNVAEVTSVNLSNGLSSFEIVDIPKAIGEIINGNRSQ